MIVKTLSNMEGAEAIGLPTIGGLRSLHRLVFTELFIPLCLKIRSAPLGQYLPVE